MYNLTHMSPQDEPNEIESITLRRGSVVVTSLAGAFGQSLREIRLTAILGYLIALEPEAYCRFFGFPGRPVSVGLETRHEQDRSDILINTSLGMGVIEAKLPSLDATLQVSKYKANWRRVLSDHIPSHKNNSPSIRFHSWKSLHAFIASHACKSKNPSSRFLGCDFNQYLEEHNMIPNKDAVEIYAREINNQETLDLFLKAGLYGCHFEKGSRFPKAQYFAPHFGRDISTTRPGIQQGISYIARVEHIETVNDWRGLTDAIISLRGKVWYNSHIEVLQAIRRIWKWDSKNYSFFFLAVPGWSSIHQSKKISSKRAMVF